MSAKPRSLSWLCGRRHFIFKFSRLLVHQEQRKNVAGFSWVLMREGPANGLGGGLEMNLLRSPQPHTLPSPTTSGWKGCREAHCPRCCSAPHPAAARSNTAPPPAPASKSRALLLPVQLSCEECALEVFTFNHHNSPWGMRLLVSPVCRGKKLLWGR